LEKLGVQTRVSTTFVSLQVIPAWLTDFYSMFVKEGLILGMVALLLVAYYLGKSMNQRRAKAWYVFCAILRFLGFHLWCMIQVEDLPRPILAAIQGDVASPFSATDQQWTGDLPSLPYRSTEPSLSSHGSQPLAATQLYPTHSGSRIQHHRPCLTIS
jgi:hypothetical protein